jgi:cytoskeletal protein RodZ
MKTVGEIIKSARLEKNLTLTDISRETRINLKYLEAIEANDFQNLPPATFTKGFMQNYAKAVGLNPQNILAIFRRDYDSDERGRIIPRGLADPVRSPINFFNPTTTTIITSVVFAVIIIGFFIRQIIAFQSAPPLEISLPLENALVISPVTVSGKTHPQATLTINNQPVTVSDSGAFETTVVLTPGEHSLIITTQSRSGKTRTLERLVTVTATTSP